LLPPFHATTWIDGFDEYMIRGAGFPAPSFIILQGPPGTGKSTFAIQFIINGIKLASENGIYVSFQETEMLSQEICQVII
jgi:circadian clock protein KaiC